MPIGPPLPPQSQQVRGAEEESSDDDYGPALPPSLAAARAEAGTSRTESPRPPRPVIGPTLPTSLNTESDDDDDVGPGPLPATASEKDANEGVRAFLEAEERRRKDLQVNHSPTNTVGDALSMTIRAKTPPNH
jgi:hypothetical protein